MAHIIELLTDYLDGALDTAKVEKVKSHVIFCQECRLALEEWEKNVESLRATPHASPPNSLKQRIINNLKINTEIDENEELAEPPFTSFPIKKRGKIAIGLLLGLLVLIGVSLGLYNKDAHPTTPPTTSKPTISMKKEAKKPPKDRPKIEKPVKTAEKDPVITKKIEENSILPTEISLFSELSGNSSGITDPLMEIVSDEGSWKSLWERHAKNISRNQPVPGVDFRSHEVVVIFIGNRPTGGYSVLINEIKETPWEGRQDREVSYQVIEPPSDAITITVINQPFSMRLVPKINGRTFFNRIP